MKKIVYYTLLTIFSAVLITACGPQSRLNKKEHSDLHKTYREISKQLPDAKVELKDDRINITLGENLLFDINKHEIKNSYFQPLDKMARILNKYPKTNILISGYTDNTGSNKFNLDLSKKRADAARDYLVSNKVDSRRIYTWGLGDKNPISSNNTEEGRSQNRRVEFVIMFNYNAE